MLNFLINKVSNKQIKMATGQDSPDLTHSQRNAGDEYFELCCTPCSKKKLNKQAVKYCVTCKEYFCVQCVDSHKIFKILSSHVLVDPRSTKTSSQSTRTRYQSVPTKLCKLHPLEEVNMYCREEDTVGCAVCFTWDHKTCTDTNYIPQYVQSNFPFANVQQITTDINQAIKDMNKLMTKQGQKTGKLDENRAACRRELQKYRKEINQIIDKLEATTLAQLDAKHENTKQKTDDMKQHIQDLQDEMVRLKSEMESDQSNDSQKFVIAKLSQCAISQGQELEFKSLCDPIKEQKFTRNADIVTFLLSIVTLGMWSPTEMQDSILPTTKTQTRTSTPQHKRQPVSGDKDLRKGPIYTRHNDNTNIVTPPQKQVVYKVVDSSHHNVSQPDDKQTCLICSSCILESGDILFTDLFNNKIKLVDSRTYSIRSSLVLDAKPQSVCRVNSTEAAVCLDNKTIQFVSTSGKLKQERSLAMNHECTAITMNRNKMYVCSVRTLYIYTLNGKLLKTIDKDKSGNSIFTCIADITVSDNEMINVADLDYEVITLNTAGKVVWRYCGTDLCNAYGVCTDGNGNVIVCGDISDNVIQLAPDGQYVGEIVHVDNPQTVCYDRNNHKLIVGKRCDDVTVFTVKNT